MDAISTLTMGIADILAERFPVNRWKIEHVPWPLTMEEFKRVLGTTPWMGISWREVRPDPDAGRSTPETLSASITVIVKNATGKAGRLLGDAAGPGLYPSVQLARLSLHTRKIEGIGTLSVTRCGQAYSDGWGDLAVAIGVIELETVTKAALPIAAGDEPPDFASLATTWDFALGEDSPADNATDIIEPGEPS
jgi:hypothetical protein